MRKALIALIIGFLVFLGALLTQIWNRPSIITKTPLSSLSQQTHSGAPTQRASPLQDPDALVKLLTEEGQKLELMEFLQVTFQLSESDAAQALGFVRSRLLTPKLAQDELTTLIAFPSRFQDQLAVKHFSLQLILEPILAGNRAALDQASALYFRAARNTEDDGENFLDTLKKLEESDLTSELIQHYALFQTRPSPTALKKLKELGIDPKKYWK